MAQSSKQRQQAWHAKVAAARCSPWRLVLPWLPPTELPRRGHKSRSWCSRDRYRAGSNSNFKGSCSFLTRNEWGCVTLPNIQAHAKGRVVTCQAHSSLQEIRSDMNKLSLLFFLKPLRHLHSPCHQLSAADVILHAMCFTGNHRGNCWATDTSFCWEHLSRRDPITPCSCWQLPARCSLPVGQKQAATRAVPCP